MVQMSQILPEFSGLTISRGAFHLRMTQKLSAGAYGVVYIAKDISRTPHGAPFYAVKCLLRHADGTDFARQQQREIAHHRAVSDVPGVVTLHAVIEEEFYTFLVLDLVSGGDLFGAIMEHGTYSNDAAVRRTMLQLVDALAACHEAGVYHRDLKPENVLCSPGAENVYLADFGLSTRSTRSSNFGCGSSFYMSPECLGIYHEKTPYLTGPSDVWALGTILCNMVSGRNPWYIASPKTDDGFATFLRDGPAWLQANLPISYGAARILGRVFELDPARRITLPELRVALEELDTFFPFRYTAPAPTPVPSSSSVPARKSATVSTPLAQRPSNVARSDSAGQLRPLDLALPSEMSTNFLSFSSEALAAAATATLVNDDTSTASHFSDAPEGGEDADVWSVTMPRPLPATPTPDWVPSDGGVDGDGGSGSSSSEESSGPDTPETYAADVEVESPVVSELALDPDASSNSPSHANANAALATAKSEQVKTKKSLGSLKGLMEGMRRIRIRTLA